MNLKDLSCFPVSVSTLIGESITMDKIVDEQEEEDETDEELPDINILPDDEMGDME